MSCRKAKYSVLASRYSMHGVRGVSLAARGVEPLGRATVLLQEALELPPRSCRRTRGSARSPLQRVLGALGQRWNSAPCAADKVADRRREVGSAEEVLELLEQRECSVSAGMRF